MLADCNGDNLTVGTVDSKVCGYGAGAATDVTLAHELWPGPLEEYEAMLGVPDPDPSRWGIRALHRNVQRLTAAISRKS